MRAITAIYTICPDLHINGWLHWMFAYFLVLPLSVYVQTSIVPCLCVILAFGYSPQVLFGCQSYLDICLDLWQ